MLTQAYYDHESSTAIRQERSSAASRLSTVPPGLSINLLILHRNPTSCPSPLYYHR